MEHKKRKMFAAIAVLMLCAVAIIGVGYAYTAVTTNSGNNAGSEYITISQNGDGKYTFASDAVIEWNTEDVAVPFESPATTYTHHKTTFTFDGTPVDITAGGTAYKAVKIGESITLHAVYSGETAPSGLYCAIAAGGTAGFVKDNDVRIIIKVVGNSTDVENTTTYMMLTGNNTLNTWDPAAQTNGAWSGDAIFEFQTSGNAFVDATVTVYMAYAGTGIEKTAEIGINPTIPVSSIAGGTLTFTITKL